MPHFKFIPPDGSTFSYYMPHLQYIPPSGFPFSNCMPHFKYIPPDGFIFFILELKCESIRWNRLKMRDAL
jgi:hypothetical protein